jgi:ComF family protein
MFRKYLDSFIRLIFPDLCAGCQENQPVKGDIFCVYCNRDLPYCEFPSLTENIITGRVYGRLQPVWASSYIYFKEGNVAQHLLHALKYRGRKDIGTEMGVRHGRYLKEILSKDRIPDRIIPVPLHPKRLHERGYNQSESYGLGLSQELEIPMDTKLLTRNRYTTTQTRKSKIDRVKNVQGAFMLKNPDKYKNQHLLLVDDVFTSGATMESCAEPLLTIPGISLSIATIALADDW